MYIYGSASLRVAVDGGTNFVFDQLGKEEHSWPHMITGDFDSVTPDVLAFYKEKVRFHVYFYNKIA